MLTEHIKDKIWNHFEEYLGVALMLIIMVMLFVQVVLRYLFNYSNMYIEEYALYIFAYFLFCSASNALLRDGHLRVTALIDRFPAKAKPYIEVVDMLFCALLGIVILYYGVETVRYAVQYKTESQTGFPLWVQHAALPFGMGFCFMIRSFQRIYYCIRFEILQKKGE